MQPIRCVEKLDNVCYDISWPGAGSRAKQMEEDGQKIIKAEYRQSGGVRFDAPEKSSRTRSATLPNSGQVL